MYTRTHLIGPPLPNLPWEDRPESCTEPIWRYSFNPVIPRNPIPCANSVFNSAVVQFEHSFAGIFRVDDRTRKMRMHSGRSPDGFSWTLNPEPIVFKTNDPYLAAFDYGYDPRVVFIEDRFLVTWCNGAHGPTIGLAETRDFESFHQLENAFLPHNRNGVLFPRRINGNYAMLSRPSDNGHTPFGEIFYSESPDLTYWGKHRWVMKPQQSWEYTKIGPGPVPIETSEGWLIFYHGVTTSCNGMLYSFGAALLDLEKPWQVIRRGRAYLFNPREPYEQVGDVPNVTFPVTNLFDPATGRIAIYYGAADTVTGLAFCYVDEIMAFLDEAANE